MFPSTQRLGRSDFAEYFAVGRRFHYPYATVVYVPRPTLRVAVVVGKKVSKQAVERNRLRRRVYAAVRQGVDHSPTVMTGVFIIILKPAAAAATRHDLRAAVFDMFAQIVHSG